MKEREKYIIVVSGEAIEVTPEVYEVYYRAERKERHFMYELKAGRSKIDKVTGEKIILPSLEDSYDHEAIIPKRIWKCVQLEIARRKKYLEEHGTNSYSRLPETNPFASKIVAETVIRYLLGKGGEAVQELTERYGSVVNGIRSRVWLAAPTDMWRKRL